MPARYQKSAIDYNHVNDTWTLERFVIIPEFRLLFCYIEKVGCTSFNRLFNILTGVKHHGRWFAHSPRQLKYNRTQLNHLLLDKSWHKAVFYRHPTDRFVSAYQSKCNPISSRHCKDTFGYKNVTFEETLEAAADHNLLENVHWIPQNIFCGGLTNTLRHYDTVELLERSTANEKVVNMLKKTQLNVTDEVLSLVNKLFPTGERKPGTNREKYNSVTNAESNGKFLLDSTEKVSAVIDHYYGDYRLFNIKLRDWEKSLVENVSKYNSFIA